jgi:hypothetical protein
MEHPELGTPGEDRLLHRIVHSFLMGTFYRDVSFAFLISLLQTFSIKVAKKP